MYLLSAPVLEVAEETEEKVDTVTWEKLLEEPEVDSEVDEEKDEDEEEEAKEETDDSLLAAAGQLEELYEMLTEEEQNAAPDEAPGKSHGPCGCW